MEVTSLDLTRSQNKTEHIARYFAEAEPLSAKQDVAASYFSLNPQSSEKLDLIRGRDWSRSDVWAAEVSSGIEPEVLYRITLHEIVSERCPVSTNRNC